MSPNAWWVLIIVLVVIAALVVPLGVWAVRRTKINRPDVYHPDWPDQ